MIGILLLSLSVSVGSCTKRDTPRREGVQGEAPAPIARKAPSIALSLSGGGYRASLHGLAALRALESFDLLENVQILSSVSGGSVTASYYTYHRARVRDTDLVFSFSHFESKLLYALSTYEIPRSVVAAETLTTGNEAARNLVRCANEKKWVLLRGEPFVEAVMQCAGEANFSMEETSLPEAITQFAGEACPPPGMAGRDALAACIARGPEEFGARLISLVMSATSEDDVREGMQRSYCSLWLQLCAAGSKDLSGRPDSGHPFAELLHLSLFKPWKPGQSVVRMKDLDEAGLTLLINAASNDHGELWSANASSAGIRHAIGPGGIGTWRRYGRDRGPALADTVAASACHPLFCRPISVPWGEAVSEPLIDGGVHDNLGVLAIRDLLESDKRQQVDLLIVADARLPATVARPTSRTDTILRVHDMLVDQHSDATVRSIGEWWPGRCRRPVHVSLEVSDPIKEPLARLSTDFNPLRDPDPRVLDSAVHRFKKALSRNPCIKTWLDARRAQSAKR